MIERTLVLILIVVTVVGYLFWGLWSVIPGTLALLLGMVVYRMENKRYTRVGYYTVVDAKLEADDKCN